MEKYQKRKDKEAENDEVKEGLRKTKEKLKKKPSIIVKAIALIAVSFLITLVLFSRSKRYGLGDILYEFFPGLVHLTGWGYTVLFIAIMFLIIAIEIAIGFFINWGNKREKRKEKEDAKLSDEERKKKDEEWKRLRKQIIFFIISGFSVYFFMQGIWYDLGEWSLWKVLLMSVVSFSATYMFLELFSWINLKQPGIIRRLLQFPYDLMMWFFIPMLPLLLIILGALSNPKNNLIINSTFLENARVSIDKFMLILSNVCFKVVRILFTFGFDRPVFALGLTALTGLFLLYLVFYKLITGKRWFWASKDPVKKAFEDIEKDLYEEILDKIDSYNREKGKEKFKKYLDRLLEREFAGLKNTLEAHKVWKEN